MKYAWSPNGLSRRAPGPSVPVQVPITVVIWKLRKKASTAHKLLDGAFAKRHVSKRNI